jgi:hypothetical protein
MGFAMEVVMDLLEDLDIDPGFVEVIALMKRMGVFQGTDIPVSKAISPLDAMMAVSSKMKTILDPKSANRGPKGANSGPKGGPRSGVLKGFVRGGVEGGVPKAAPSAPPAAKVAPKGTGRIWTKKV